MKVRDRRGYRGQGSNSILVQILTVLIKQQINEFAEI